MGKIWVTSDLHFMHNKPFIYEQRGFQSVYEMNEAIVKRFNEVVKPEDDVYILGDLMLNDNEAGRQLINRLNGWLHIVYGNHDTSARREIYSHIWKLVEAGDALTLKYKYHFYLSHYPTLCANYDEDKPLKARIINLCGHSHTTDPFADWDKGLIYHCEVDAHNCAPVLLDDIICDCENKLKRKD